jgi:signal transduction histidine kinase
MSALLARLRRPAAITLPARVLDAARRWVPVIGAVVFLFIWLLHFDGYPAFPQKLVAAVAWAAVLGVAGFLPAAAVIGSVGVLAAEWAMAVYLANSMHSGLAWALQLSDSWQMWWVVPIALGYVAATQRAPRLRIGALGAGVVGAVGYALLVANEGWPDWRVTPAFIYPYVWHSLPQQLSEAALGLTVMFVVVAVALWLIAVGLSALWRVQLVSGRLEATTAQLDEADLELRLAHDRGRISRDIHDSLAHSLAIIVAQAEGAAAIHELKPEAAPESLANIATVARHALGEVRRLVERINDDEDVSEHTSRLEHIPALVDEVRSAGVDAALRVLGEPGPLALSKQVAVYRIVQESLTNALKHGGRGTAATVTLDAQGAGLAVLVVSKSGGGEPLVGGGGRGIGIAGMKERARLVGGWLTAVPSDDETFVVTAFIPPDAQSDDGRGSEASVAAARASAPDSGRPVAASDDVIDAESQTAALAIEGAHD